MYFVTCIVLLLFLATELSGKNVNCTQETVCTCYLKSAGLLNLAGSGGAMSYVEVTSGEYTFRYYPCGITESWGGLCKVSNSPAVCQYAGQNDYFVLGKSSGYQLTKAVAKGDDTYFDFVFIDGTFDPKYGARKALVKVKCEEIENSELVFLKEDPIVNYNFILRTNKACLTPSGIGGQNGMALFITVIVSVLIGTILYMSVGFGVQAVRGKRGLQLIPNLTFWKKAPFLFLDGFLFVFSCIPIVRGKLRNANEEGSYKEVPE